MMALLLMQQLVLWCGRCCCLLLLVLMVLLMLVLLFFGAVAAGVAGVAAGMATDSFVPQLLSSFKKNARETRLLRKAVAPALGKVRHALRQLPAKASYVVPGVDAGADRFES